ncbi:hypothetical protein SAMN05421803_11369 [Nocardiopsis flavescens]|uniref:ABC-type transport system involved in multi-copper enzyme maturation, permease component n=1 Tax=Nocardiopsis flavescens TaxID=758803 RepID=A0A1M6PGA5_9ACTN|nr:hypothetical protein [Nocardiopsis flavescens]SHK06954.1 hypothetical protein SAMN05421803_11369 [Nocardiopsis flavescens]
MRRTATFARLTLFNMLRLLRGPFLLPGTALFMAYFGWAGPFPGQSVDTWYADLTSAGLLIAAIGFGAVTPSAVREARHPVVSTTPLGRTGRVLALALAAVPLLWAVLGGLAAWLWLTAGPLPPAGIVNPYALPVPFLVAAAGPFGAMLLVLWTRSYLPLVMLALCLPLYLVYNGILLSERLNSAVSRASTALQQAVSPFPDFSVSLAGVGVYSLVYTSLALAALVALVVGARHRVRRVLIASAVTAAVLASGAVGVAVHGNRTVWPDAAGRPRTYGDDEIHGVDGPWPCREIEGVDYCPLPGYDSWVPSWHATLSPVLEELPGRARANAPVVWQDASWFSRAFEVSGPAVVVSDYMDPSLQPWQSYLYATFARKTLGMSAGAPSPHGMDDCRGTGQARSAAVVWVVDRVVSSHIPHDRFMRTDAVATAMTDMAPSPADLALGREIVAVPPDRVRAVLEEHWEEISSGRMDTLELAALLDVRVPADQTRIAGAPEWDSVFSDMNAGMYETWNPSLPLCPVSP